MPLRRLPLTCRRVLLLAAAGGAAWPLVGCASPDPVPFDPRALRQIEIEAAAQEEFRRPADAPATPRTSDGRVDVAAIADERHGEPETGLLLGGETDAEPLRLRLSGAVGRALLNNFDLAVAAYEPAIDGTRVTEAEAAFDPVFQSTFEYQYLDNQVANNLSFNNLAVVVDRQRLYSFATALSQPLPSGGQAELSYNAQYIDSPTNVNRGISAIEETYESQITLRFTQPFLRDFGRDVNRARISIAQNTRRESILTFRQQVEELALQVEQTYWQLYQAQQEVEIQRDLLRRTQETVLLIRLRLAVDANESQLFQALTDLDERRALLRQAEASAAQLQVELKRLMSDPDLPVAGGRDLRLTTEPVDRGLLFDYQQALDLALLVRAEVAAQIIRAQSAGVALRVAQNNLLPRLDAVVTGGFQGLDESFDQAVSNQFEFDNFTFGVGVQLEIPLGNVAARSILRRATMQRGQQIAQYNSLRTQIAAELKQAQQAVEANYVVLQLRRTAAIGAAETVRVAEAQEREVALTPEFSDRKLRLLSRLAQARSAEVAALANYNTSLAQFQAAQGTLLRYNNITLAEAGVEVLPPTYDALVPPARPEAAPMPRFTPATQPTTTSRPATRPN
jgi:outer membrane protein TolC